MIIGFTGIPGSGKTYDAVRKILNDLSLGRVVCTNIDGMNSPECREMIKNVCGLSETALDKQLIFLKPDQAEGFWNHVTPGALVVLDEVDRVFDPRAWQAEKNKNFYEWCSTHRRYNFDLFLITQGMDRIYTAVRALFFCCYVFRRVNAGSKQEYIRNTYVGDSTSGLLVKQKVRAYDPKVFRCYQSYADNDMKPVVAAHSADTRA